MSRNSERHLNNVLRAFGAVLPKDSSERKVVKRVAAVVIERSFTPQWQAYLLGYATACAYPETLDEINKQIDARAGEGNSFIEPFREGIQDGKARRRRRRRADDDTARLMR